MKNKIILKYNFFLAFFIPFPFYHVFRVDIYARCCCVYSAFNTH